jgi:hypothetical protein
MTQPKIVQYPFAGGIDNKTAQEYLDPNARQYSVVNGNFTKVGAIDKRVGIKALNSGGVLPPNGTTLLTNGQYVTSWNRSDVTMIDDSTLYFYSQAFDAVAEISPLPPVYPLRRPVNSASQGTFVFLLDFPYNNRNLRIAFSMQLVPAVGTNVVATVYDSDTGDIILEPTVIQQLASLTGLINNAFVIPGALPANQIAIFTQDPTNGVLYLINYSPSTNTFSAPTTLVTVTATNPAYDVVPYVNDPQNGFIVLYNYSSTLLNWAYFFPTGAFDVSRTFAVPAMGQTLQYPNFAVATYGEQNWAVFATKDGSSVYRYFMLQYSGDYVFTIGGGGSQQATIPDNSGLTGAVRLDNSHLLITFQYGQNYSSAKGIECVQIGWSCWNNVFGETFYTDYGPVGYYALARPFMFRGVPYMVCAFLLFDQVDTGSNVVQSQQVTMYLMQWQNVQVNNQLLPVATVAKNVLSVNYQLLYTTLYWSGHHSLMNVDSTGTRFSIGLVTAGESVSVQSGFNQQSWTCDFFFDEEHIDNMYATSELGSELHISGGSPFITDAKTAFEDNFFNYPEFSYSIWYNASSADLSDGLYQYAICYSYQTASGLIHRSAPFFISPITFPNPSLVGYGIQLQILSYQATWKDIDTPGQVFAEIYRTTANGSIFYFLDRIACSNTHAPYIAYPSSISVDNVSDANLQTASLLYTTGGVLPNINPPAFLMQITHCGRIAGVDETLQQVWFSQVFEPGAAPGFSGTLVVPFPEKGDITAIASMDDKFLVFKESSIWVMQGLNGPSPTSSGSDWTVPIQIPTNVGCISSQAIETTDVGVFFQSNNGIYLLGRDLSVSWIGAQVQDLTNQYPIIVDIVKIPEAQQIRFICTDGTYSAAIVYDYYLKQWSLHTYAQFVMPVASACLSYQSPNLLTILTGDGQLWQENAPGSTFYWFDTNTSSNMVFFVPTSVSTAWIKTSVQGYSQVITASLKSNLATGADLCGLQIQLALNGDNTIVQTVNWNQNQLAVLAIPGQVQMFIGAKYNMGQEYQFTVSDTTPYASNTPTAGWTGQGAVFIGLAIETQELGPRYLLIPAGARST